jgi:hypothetical protein
MVEKNRDKKILMTYAKDGKKWTAFRNVEISRICQASFELMLERVSMEGGEWYRCLGPLPLYMCSKLEFYITPRISIPDCETAVPLKARFTWPRKRGEQSTCGIGDMG